MQWRLRYLVRTLQKSLGFFLNPLCLFYFSCCLEFSYGPMKKAFPLSQIPRPVGLKASRWIFLSRRSLCGVCGRLEGVIVNYNLSLHSGVTYLQKTNGCMLMLEAEGTSSLCRSLFSSNFWVSLVIQTYFGVPFSIKPEHPVRFYCYVWVPCFGPATKVLKCTVHK